MKTIPTGVRHGLELSEADLSLEYSSVSVRGSELKYADAGRVSRKRAGSLTTKEPATLAWLDSFQPGEILFDVGANVGMYSVWAAALNKTTVYAFEPEALNYAELNKNIYLNRLHGRVTAYCCGVSDSPKTTVLYLSRFVPAFSHHDCGQNLWEGPVTTLASSPESRPRQGCLAVSLDDLVIIRHDLPQPHHIKIDVDGLEPLVVRGAQRVLQSPDIRTVLIETDFKRKTTPALIRGMDEGGWRFSMDQVCAHHSGNSTPDQWRDQLADRKGGCNIIWFREKDRDFYESYFRDKCAA